MTDVLAIVLPVFGLIALGLVLRASGYFGQAVEQGLSRFVFALAVPALIFRALSGSPLPDHWPLTYWTAYFGGALVVAALAFALSWRRDGAAHEAVSVGLTASFSNTVLLGIPLTLSAFGEAAAVPLFLLVSVHLPFLLGAATVAMEAATPGGGGLSQALARIGASLMRNPIFVAILLGGLWGALQWPVPTLAGDLLDRLSDAALPCALIAMGMTLVTYAPKTRGEWASEARLIGAITTLKLLVHPALVLGLALLFHLPPAWTAAATLFAACPAGVNTYLFATLYGRGVRVASLSIAVTSGASLVTITGWLAVLQRIV